MSMYKVKIIPRLRSSVKIRSDKVIPPFILQEKTATESGVVVPDSGYAGLSKVTVDVYSVAKLLNAKKHAALNQLFSGVTSLTGDDLFGIFSQVDSDFAPTQLAQFFYGCSSLTKVPLFDTSNVTNANEMFNRCSKLKEVPTFDFSSLTGFYGMFTECSELEEVPLFKTTTGKIDTAHYMFYNCRKLKKIPKFDFRNVTRLDYFSLYCTEITEIWVRNIKVNLQVGSGTLYGHKLTIESLIHLIYELRDTGSAKTFTVGSLNLEKLENVYVRQIEITDKMRVEDDLIDEKLPFEVCESTDDGAMLITSYVNFKNWELR